MTKNLLRSFDGTNKVWNYVIVIDRGHGRGWGRWLAIPGIYLAT